MFDFINIEVTALLPKNWLENPILQAFGFPLEVMENTGEILDKKRIAEYKGLTFILIPSSSAVGYVMLLRGSLHTYWNNGKHNYNRFKITDCIGVIESLFKDFGINPQTSVLHGLEFGVNLSLPYSPQKVIQSVIVHKNTPYEAINKRKRVGVVCVRNMYEVKIYDKGFVCGLFKENILRIEYKVFKMHQLDGLGISVLSDLCEMNKIKPLINLLIDAVKDSVFIPPDTDLSNLTIREQSNFHAMGKASTWKECTPKQRFDKRNTLYRILEKCKAFDYQKDLVFRILEELKEVLKSTKKASKNVMFLPDFSECEAVENVTFLPLEYRVKTLRKGFEKDYKDSPLSMGIMDTPKRVCVSCGKDISMNKPNSVFCSEKYNLLAKQCRNKDSNRRRNFKRIIMSASNKNKWLRITYKSLSNSETYTDVLHGSEVAVNREYLDSIQRVEIFHDSPNLYHEPNYSAPEIIEGEKAKEILKDLTNENETVSESFN